MEKKVRAIEERIIGESANTFESPKTVLGTYLFIV